MALLLLGVLWEWDRIKAIYFHIIDSNFMSIILHSQSYKNSVVHQFNKLLGYLYSIAFSNLITSWLAWFLVAKSTYTPRI